MLCMISLGNKEASVLKPKVNSFMYLKSIDYQQNPRFHPNN